MESEFGADCRACGVRNAAFQIAQIEEGAVTMLRSFVLGLILLAAGVMSLAASGGARGHAEIERLGERWK
jgi:hypothetical protein